MSGSLEAKVSGHTSVSGMVREMETKRVKVTESDKTISCNEIQTSTLVTSTHWGVSPNTILYSYYMRLDNLLVSLVTR